MYSNTGLSSANQGYLWGATNDGAGSGLDADLLDGLSSASFMPAATDNWVNTTGDTMTGGLTVPSMQFTGVGGDSGQSAPGSDYRIYQAPGAWSYPYPDLNIAYHTGISIGAHWNYGGTRFFNNSDMATELMSIGNSDNNIRISNNLYTAGSVVGSSGINTGAGAGTQRIDASGNLTNIGTISSGAITSTQFNGSGAGLTGTAASLTAGNLSGFTNSNSSNPISGPDSATNNGIGYVTGVSLFGQTDGALYTQAYSPSWVGQIYQDYRTGQIALRGKNSGTWQNWRSVIDSSNISSYAMTSGNNTSYPVTAGEGNGLKFWNGSDTYKVSMGNGAEYHYGPVTDYSIKTAIDSNGNTRGFTWGQNGATPVAALNVGTGDFQTAGKITSMGTTTINNDLILMGQGTNTYSYLTQWTQRESARDWYSVAISTDGSRQTGVVYSGQIYTSSDYGVSWTPRDSNRGWFSVAMSSDGSRQTAGEFSGLIYTSSDYGATWTPRASSGLWRSIAMSSDGSRQTAVNQSGQIYTSSDYGVSWTPRESARTWYSVDMSSDGSRQTAVVLSGQIYTSSDYGVSWTPRASNRAWTAIALSADGSRQTAVTSPGQIYTSSDYGVTWTPQATSQNWNSVDMSSDGSKIIASAGAGSGLLAGVYISSDYGVTWNSDNLNMFDVAISSDGNHYLTGGVLSTMFNRTSSSQSIPNARLGINTSNPLRALQVVGDIRVGGVSGSGCIENFNGGQIAGTCSSDERLKTDIMDLPSLLAKLKDLRVVNYKWNETAQSIYSNDTAPQNTGYLAQNVESLFPEMVATDRNGYKQVNYTGLGIYAVKGLQELALQSATTTSILAALSTMQASTTLSLASTTVSLMKSIDDYTMLASSTIAITQNIVDIEELLATQGTALSSFTTETNGYVGIGMKGSGDHPLVMLHTMDMTATGTVARFQSASGYCDIDPSTGGLVCTTDDDARTNVYLIDTASSTVASTTATMASSTLEKITNLNVVRYSLPGSVEEKAGLIREDIEALFPELVAVDSYGRSTITVTNLIPYIIESIKSLSLAIESFKHALVTEDLTAKNVSTDNVDTGTLCVGSGTSKTCIDKGTLDELLLLRASQAPITLPAPQVAGTSTDATSTPQEVPETGTSTEPVAETGTSTPSTGETAEVTP